MGVAVLAQPESAVLGGDLDAERADLPESAHDLLGNLAFAIDLVAVHPLEHEPLEPSHEGPGALEIVGVRSGEGVHEVESERALEELAHEAGRLPFLFPGGLCDFSGLLLRCERGARIPDRWLSEHVSHGWRQG